MPALGITDYGNLFGAPEFHHAASSAGIKPILGMEAYLCANRLEKSKLIYHLVLFAKSRTGYHNLAKLASLGYLEGFYYKPRIDKALLRQYSEGLIGTSACLKGEIPQRLIHGRYDEARALAAEYVEIFGGDFYLEIQRHGLDVEPGVIEGMLRLSRELNIPVVATNDIHYVDRRHAASHDILLCIQSGKNFQDVTRPRYPGDTFCFRSSGEMRELFRDVPQAIENTVGLVERCDFQLEMGRAQLPRFALPPGFGGEDEYLRHLAERGLEKKMGPAVTPEVRARLEYELQMIARMGFPGYFLVVQDFIRAAKDMGVSVGPGRGSAAGSLVSYAIDITNIDPIRYNLLFERFLNPDRISMPDIDIDFDDRNRDKVIDYVIGKYGKDSVAQIITFGTMQARGVLRDVARALNVSLSDADRIAKLVPRRLGITLKDAIQETPELKALQNSPDETMRQLVEHSLVLEGLVRQPGIHAAGVVITPKPLTELIPIYKSAKDEIATQYDKDWVEKIGLLKMDFLGLTTLTILNDALALIRHNHGVDVDLDRIPLDDEKVFQLFWRGETVGIFQFESQGMTEYMKQLRPTSVDDLIAMNALYRPGPMEFIPNYIARKHGREPVDCFHHDLEPVLKSTYGVIVYQEQVMQVAQILAGFTLGKADVVRRIMAKKKPEELAKVRPDWIQGATALGYSKELAEKIFDILVPFSNYAFNKSHSAAYAILAYQTAYLKTHYPAEFMAAVLSSEMANTDRIAVLINACRDMDLQVLPPDVNESVAEFSVQQRTIRFGLGAVKNVGLGAIESIVKARESGGRFRTLLDLCERTDLRLVNKKVVESLIMSGACDSLEGHRAQQFEAVEKVLSMANKRQEQLRSDQVDIFVSADGEAPSASAPVLILPEVARWAQAELLAKERELLGFYVSGHPLDKFRFELETFSNFRFDDERYPKEGSEIRIGGMITEIRQIFDRKGNPMAFVRLEGFGGSLEAVVFASIMKDYASLIRKEQVVMVIGKASYRNEALSVVADRIFAIERVYEMFTGALSVMVTRDQLSNGVGEKILDVLRRQQENTSPGTSCQVHLRVEFPEKQAVATYRVNKFQVVPTRELVHQLSLLLGKGRVSITLK
jgi:DNA polymerase-3 subunit alpha